MDGEVFLIGLSHKNVFATRFNRMFGNIFRHNIATQRAPRMRSIPPASVPADLTNPGCTRVYVRKRRNAVRVGQPRGESRRQDPPQSEMSPNDGDVGRHGGLIGDPYPAGATKSGSRENIELDVCERTRVPCTHVFRPRGPNRARFHHPTMPLKRADY